MKIHIIYTLLVIAIEAKGQTITLSQSEKMALDNFTALQAQKLSEAYYLKLKETNFDLPRATFGSEFGQFNTKYFDSKWQFSQSFSLPVVYETQQKVYQKQAEKALTESQISELEVKTNIRKTYYNYLILREKEEKILWADSLFRNYVLKAELRLKAGETSRLEKLNAELQLGQVAMERILVKSQIQQVIETFNYLLHSDGLLIPADAPMMIPEKMLSNIVLSENLHILFLEKNNELLLQEQALEKKKQLPEFTLSYANQSIIGNQDINGVATYFGGNSRFHFGNVGINIPLSKKASKNKIAAYSILLEQNKLFQQAKAQELNNALAVLLAEKLRLNTIIDAYKNTLLQNSEMVYNTATRQLTSGELSFVDWVVLIKEHIAINQKYLEIIGAYNVTVIEIQKLIEK